jgi:tetratricopeptide (TPR) repeat protein
MLVREVLEATSDIPDPYVRAVTYARIGERLAKAREPLFKEAFVRAIETAKEVDDPVKMFRALISIGHAMGKVGIRSYKKVFLQVSEDSKILPPELRDEIMRSLSLSLLNLGQVGEAITYAVEIASSKLRQETMVQIVRRVARSIEERPIQVAYNMRKIKLALEYLPDEPHRSKALLELMKALIALKSYENALATVRAMGSREWARQAFKELVYRLKSHGVLDHYINSVEELATDLVGKFGESFTRELATAFALSGNGEIAAELIEESGDRRGIVEMSLELLKRAPDVLPTFIGSLSDELAYEAGKALMNAVLERPERARPELINALAKLGNEEILAKIARYHVLTGNVEGARAIGSALADTHLRSMVMADVAREYLRRGDVESAIEVAFDVREPDYASILMSEILVRALEMKLGGDGNGETR